MTGRGRLRLRCTVGVLALAAGLFAAQQVAARPRADPQPPDPRLVAEGRQLFLVSCSSCHGTDARGVVGEDRHRRGPSLRNVGSAAAFYQLKTGRMPLADAEQQPTNKPSPFTDHQIDALVAYVGTLGSGPTAPPIDVHRADLAAGGELFRSNCAPCHNAAGAGGALSYGRAAPSLVGVEPDVVGAAVRVGPGQMPRFARQTLSDRNVNDIAAYVHYLKNPDDRGGLPLGRFGPVPEGFAIWVLGLGLLLIATVWISKRVHQYRRDGER